MIQSSESAQRGEASILKFVNCFILVTTACFCLKPSIAPAQTDEQLEALRAEIRKSGIESILVVVAEGTKKQIASMPPPSPNLRADNVLAQGKAMIMVWRVIDQTKDQINPDADWNALRNHSIRTVCRQRVRGMFVNEFNALMKTRVIDKDGQLVYEATVDKAACQALK